MSITYVMHDEVRQGSMENFVTGHSRNQFQYRPLYFKRPLATQIQDIPIKLAPLQQEQQVQYEFQEEQKIIEEPLIKNAEAQTDFRESEAQTDPYTPKYIIKQLEQPEVLSLQNLYFGKGLPASIDELENIEASREKVWFENALPPISDEFSFNLRRRLMEEQELREWTKKENEIKKFQNERLYLLQSALIEREKDVEEKNAERIEEIKIKKTEQKNRRIAKIQRKKIKVLRKLSKRRQDIEKKKEGSSLIDEYANFGSKVYAGITREGLSLDKLANKYEVQPISLTTYKGISDLHESIQDQYFSKRINVEKIQKEILKKYTRLQAYHRQEISKAKELIKGKLQKQEEKTPDLFQKFNQGIEGRPDTPPHYKHLEHLGLDKMKKISDEKSIQMLDNTIKDFQRREQVVLLLQRLIRGRHWQNIMYEGKQKRLALIDELLKIARIDEQQKNKEEEEERIEEILTLAHTEKARNAVLESIQGEAISQTLDGLSKELLIITQEKKIAKLVEQAEKERRLREIEESGKRQAELVLRARQDSLYNNIMKVHQTTVDNYLNWVMNGTLELSAIRQAKMRANLRKEYIGEPVEKIEKQKHSNPTIIKELVTNFLIPTIKRSELIKQIEQEEKRFEETSKVSLINTMSNVQKQLSNIQKKNQ